MSSEPVFRRVGRGGAGNWYSKQDIEDAEKKTQAADLEGQKTKQASAPLAATTTAANAASTAAAYARGGRGGAGNFAPPTAVSGIDASTTQHEREQGTERTKAAVAASKPRTGGLSGRGGVGNWMDSATAAAGGETPQKVEQERKKLEEMELEVLKNVEAGLAMPRPAYHKQDRDT
ncbi:hypothetical protein B0T22DRAFT_447464 [Podospora appendiculata]|uniref:Uncharacterized protein n=1 Tax=Podospora appendiculata TaxID=314037 RepID=A0AAE0XFX9_9PEZI|nr:hypothetical protein B0T22DRAFT_447464 [Podospora appendiculata]